MNLKELLNKAIYTSLKGGEEIMKIYDSAFDVDYKSDNSPLTLADKNCNQIIEDYLSATDIPILSEEGRKTPYVERKKWDYFWLVDPLDGTKEFVKRNGEFTVNIALIHNKTPVLGVVFVPVSNELYFALEGLGSFKINLSKITQESDLFDQDIDILISLSEQLPRITHREIYTIVGSRSHMSLETEDFFTEKRKEHGLIDVVSIGSSLKLCMVAEGRADTYPRYAPTMEWDTGAGHAIVKYAGFSVKEYNTHNELIYNKEDLLNPWFLVE